MMRYFFGFSLLLLSACKFGGTSDSVTMSEQDGGCFDMQMELVSLIAQHRSFFQNNDVDPTAAEGLALQGSGSSTSLPVTQNNQGATTGQSSGFDPTFGGQLSPLIAKIESKQVELKSCLDKKFGQTTDSPATQGNQSHINYTGQQYDILNYNCHSAANVAVKVDAKKVGIISCGGNAPVAGSPAHHTFNYRVEGDLIVYYNWGKTCKAPNKVLPPDITDPDHQLCAATFCGDQYDPETTSSLGVGTVVEEPGPLYCSQTESSKTSCDSCCQFRGKYWDTITDDMRPTDRTFVQFMSQCYNACSEKFR